MPQYRLYALDDRQKIHSSTDCDFDTDHQAMEEAYRVASHKPGVEVWCGGRMVARFPHLGPVTRDPPFKHWNPDAE